MISPGFFYFFPRLCGVDEFNAAGLADRFDGTPIMEEIADGPDGLAGIVFHRCPGGRAPQRNGLNWMRSMSGEFWVGHHPDHPPHPLELRRMHEARCIPVRMGDNRDWLIPIVSPLVGQSGLPSSHQRSRDNVSLLPLPQYDPLIRWCDGWVRSVDTAEFPDDSTIFDGVVSLLGVMQRVGADECIALGLITQQSANVSIFVACDLAERLKAKMQSAVTV